MEIELIADYQCQIGENPLWHPFEKRLYWTDIYTGRLFRFDPVTNQHEVCFSGPRVGGFTIQADGTLLLFMECGAIAKWRPELSGENTFGKQHGRLEYLVEQISAEIDGRFNDVIADPLGRVYCGTVATPPGSRPGRLYRLDADGTLHLLLEGVGISNGLGFTQDHKCLFHTDSLKRTITLYDYDQSDGSLSNPRIWLDLTGEPGEPDGLTVDSQGYVWSARWNDSALYRYTPDGILEQRIQFPALKVSSLTFAGDDLADVYVTTALSGGDKTIEGSGAGALFRLRTGIRGVPEFFSKISI